MCNANNNHKKGRNLKQRRPPTLELVRQAGAEPHVAPPRRRLQDLVGDVTATGRFILQRKRLLVVCMMAWGRRGGGLGRLVGGAARSCPREVSFVGGGAKGRGAEGHGRRRRCTPVAGSEQQRASARAARPGRGAGGGTRRAARGAGARRRTPPRRRRRRPARSWRLGGRRSLRITIVIFTTGIYH